MKTTTDEHLLFFNKIHGALSLLDSTGTNETVTRAMIIVYEGFKSYEKKIQFTAEDLLIASIKSNLNET